MKDLKEIIAESLLDIDDSTLDLLNDDLMDIFNSKSEDEWDKRWDALKFKIETTAELAPMDKKGYLIRKVGRLYIRIPQYADYHVYSPKSIQLGRDNNGYVIIWNRSTNRAHIKKSKHLNFKNELIKNYIKYPLYILPDDLKKSYREIITKL